MSYSLGFVEKIKQENKDTKAEITSALKKSLDEQYKKGQKDILYILNHANYISDYELEKIESVIFGDS